MKLNFEGSLPVILWYALSSSVRSSLLVGSFAGISTRALVWTMLDLPDVGSKEWEMALAWYCWPIPVSCLLTRLSPWKKIHFEVFSITGSSSSYSGWDEYIDVMGLNDEAIFISPTGTFLLVRSVEWYGSLVKEREISVGA